MSRMIAPHSSSCTVFLTNSKSEYNAVKSVACKSIMGSMVTYDFDCTPDFVIELI